LTVPLTGRSVSPVDNVGGLFALFTMTFCVAMSLYKLTLLDA